MGYTHKWTIKEPLGNNRSNFEFFIERAHFILKHAPSGIKIKGYNGKGRFECSIESGICFNGDASKKFNADTFSIKPTDEGFHFCKTNFKPYDLIVCAILITAERLFKSDIIIDSDGGKSAFDAAKIWLEKIIKYYEKN